MYLLQNCLFPLRGLTTRFNTPYTGVNTNNKCRENTMKWVKRVLLSLVGLSLLVFVVVYAGSEYVIRKTYVAETRAVPSFQHGRIG